MGGLRSSCYTVVSFSFLCLDLIRVGFCLLVVVVVEIMIR